MLSPERHHPGTASRVVVRRGPRGWDVTEERDHAIVRQVTYTDWHRVERAVQAFERREAAGGPDDYSTNR